MKRIIWHWTAGGSRANAVDRQAYHFIIDADGTRVEGVHPPERNRKLRNPGDSSTYAAHTARLNTGSIGVAMAGMMRATERPFSLGPSPITEDQLDELARLTAELCLRYEIPVGRETTLSHAEVPVTLGVPQSRWDITWLPGMSAPGDPVAVGDVLRERVRAAMRTARPPAPTGWAAIFAALSRLFRRD